MPVIRADAHISDGSGNHAEFAYSYASFERILEAMNHLRVLNASYGYYYRTATGKETYNLGTNSGQGSPMLRANNIPTGVAQPYKVTTLDEPTPTPGRKTTQYSVRHDKNDDDVLLHLTNCSGSTMNALAKALAGGSSDAAGCVVPKLTDGWLPKKFNDYWNIVVLQASDIDSAAKKEEWGQGSARAIQHFNLGVQIDPLQLRRGDAVQLGSKASQPHHGHSVYCYATRRLQGDEVRFVFLSSQIDTFGVGVRLNDIARMGILSEGVPPEAPGLYKFSLVIKDEDTGEKTPLEDRRFILQVGNRVYVGRTDEEGRLEVESRGPTPVGTLTFWLEEDSEDEDDIVSFPLKVARAGDGDQTGSDTIEGKARLEWVVSFGSRPFRKHVYHPGSMLVGRFVTHAYRYGKWQVLRPGDQGKHKLFTPWRGHPHAARINAEFPRYPISLGNSNDLDWIDTEGNTADAHTTSLRFYRNNEGMTGGYFPIGRSRVWHNGIHLAPDGEDKNVYAMFDGRVVAARMCDFEGVRDDAGEKMFPFGSGNFVLLKHKAKIGGTETEFFSLVMHLANPKLELQEEEERLLSDEAALLPWLHELALAPDAPEDKDEINQLDEKCLYFKIYRKPPAGTEIKLGDKELAKGDLLKVGDAAVTEDQWKVWNGAKAGPVTRVSDGAQGDFDAKAYIEAGGMVAPFDAWPKKLVEAKEKLLKGEVVDLWEHEIMVRCGEPLGKVGTWQNAEKVHVEIFSKDLIKMKVEKPADGDGDPTWEEKAAVDHDSAGDNKAFMDRKKFLDDFFAAVEDKANEAAGLDGTTQAMRLRERMLGNITNKDDAGTIKETEVQRFFNDPDNSLLKFFRNLVVRHLSEWGDKVKWEDIATEAKDSLGKPLEGPLKQLGKMCKHYIWYQGDVGKDAGLPSDQVLHFYHPITFLLWLEHERSEEVAKGGADDLHKSVIESLLVEGPGGGGGGGGDDGGDDDADPNTKPVRFRVGDTAGNYLEGQQYELKVGDQTESGTTQAGGLIEHRFPLEASEGELTLTLEGEDPQTCKVVIP